MGFLGDLFGSSSHSQTTSSTSNVTNTQLAGGNIAGPALYGSSGNYISVQNTDAGAIQSATDIGSAALALGAAASAAGDEVAIAGLSHAQDAYTSSLALVGNVTKNSLNNDYAISSGAIDSVSTFAGSALDRTARFASSALDSNTYIAGKALDSTAAAYSDSLASTANANAKALGAVEDIAAQVSQSSQQTTDTTVQKIIWALVIGVIAIVVIPKLK
jgi:hypothetical protein